VRPGGSGYARRMGKAERATRARIADENRHYAADHARKEADKRSARQVDEADLRRLTNDALFALKAAGWPDGSLVKLADTSFRKGKTKAGWKVTALPPDTKGFADPASAVAWGALDTAGDPVYLLADGRFVRRGDRPGRADYLARLGVAYQALDGLRKLAEKYR
jgi:hypothetical protein